MRTSVHTSEAHGTMVAGDGFLVRHTDVLHRADTYTCVATGTLVGVHFRTHAMNHASLYCRATEKPRKKTEPTIVKRVTFCLQLADNQLHASRHTFELTQLLVRITSECKSTIIGYRHLMTVSQFNALLAQDAAQHPHAITHHTAAGDDRKDVRFRTNVQLRYHIA